MTGRANSSLCEYFIDTWFTLYHDMKAKLLQWDPKNLRDGVVHEGVKPVKSRR